MNAYEVMLMLDPELDEERQNEMLARVRVTISSWRSSASSGSSMSMTSYAFTFPNLLPPV